jgi:acyl-CoA hydrolase
VRTAGLSRDGFTLKGGIGSIDQKLVEKLVRTHTNLVLRESLDDTLRHLLPRDIEFVIDEPVDEQEEEPEV